MYSRIFFYISLFSEFCYYLLSIETYIIEPDIHVSVNHNALFIKTTNKMQLIFPLWRCDPTRVMVCSFLRFLDHTQRRTTVGRTPLDEWSALRRDHYLTTHNTHNKQTSMPPVGFEPTISACERPQTYALDRAATRTGNKMQLCRINLLFHYSLTVLHVSSDIIAHHQEHLTVITASGFIHACRFQLLSWLSHDSSRQRHTWIKPEAVITVKMLLMMNDNMAWNV